MKIHRRKSPLASKITLALIFVTVLVVVGAVVVSNLYEDNYFVEKKFEEISRDYYENVVYENFIKEHPDEDLEKAFGKYLKYGFTVHLRQILNYNLLEKNRDDRPVFDTKTYSCDTNSSLVKFTPKSPYKKTDYDAEFKLDCTNN